MTLRLTGIILMTALTALALTGCTDPEAALCTSLECAKDGPFILNSDTGAAVLVEGSINPASETSSANKKRWEVNFYNTDKSERIDIKSYHKADGQPLSAGSYDLNCSSPSECAFCVTLITDCPDNDFSNLDGCDQHYANSGRATITGLPVDEVGFFDGTLHDLQFRALTGTTLTDSAATATHCFTEEISFRATTAAAPTDSCSEVVCEDGQVCEDGACVDPDPGESCTEETCPVVTLTCNGTYDFSVSGGCDEDTGTCNGPTPGTCAEDERCVEGQFEDQCIAKCDETLAIDDLVQTTGLSCGMIEAMANPARGFRAKWGDDPLNPALPTIQLIQWFDAQWDGSGVDIDLSDSDSSNNEQLRFYLERSLGGPASYLGMGGHISSSHIDTCSGSSCAADSDPMCARVVYTVTDLIIRESPNYSYEQIDKLSETLSPDEDSSWVCIMQEFTLGAEAMNLQQNVNGTGK